MQAHFGVIAVDLSCKGGRGCARCCAWHILSAQGDESMFSASFRGEGKAELGSSVEDRAKKAEGSGCGQSCHAFLQNLHKAPEFLFCFVLI